MCLTPTTLPTSPRLLILLRRCKDFVFTLLSAGAAYIQNDVLLGVDADKISAFKGQVARCDERIVTVTAGTSQINHNDAKTHIHQKKVKGVEKEVRITLHITPIPYK